MTKGLALAALLLLAVPGCGDDGGAGGGGAGTTSGSSSSGGGGAGGAGGAGGGGGCVDASLYDDVLTVSDPVLCVVAVYAADVTLGYTAAPTWGRHGGPLVVFPGAQGSVDLLRLTPPAGAAGALAAASAVADTGIPDGAFVGAQAVDLPFFGWTMISWAGAFPDTAGEVLVVDEAGAVAARYGVNGLYAAAGLAAPDGVGRLLYTGLSAVGDVAQGENGLYAADSCGAADMAPRLTPDGDPTCAAPAAVTAWGDFSGPLATDLDGNVFVVLPSFAGDQEARAFAAATVARGQGAAAGDTLFTLPGAGSSLAALAPQGGADGIIVFQPTHPTSFDPLDPVAIAYSVAGDVVQAGGAPAPLLKLATPATLVTLMADDGNRLWVGAPSAGGGTTFVVLARP